LCDLKIKSQEKVNITDFALWKASKAGEPFWSSPWGNGRPGWHIECSVMATAICGPTLDIHAGGFDLKFPHHDNEIAQTEAHFEHDQWVNYFLHAGTLKIAGLKMSKSLKNFITIKDALKQYSARQLRLLFLFHNWADVLDYSPSTMEGALNFEKTCNEFFLSTKFYVRQYFRRDDASTYVKFHEIECNLNEKFTAAKSKVHDALCDSVDTRTVVEALKELISAANVYVNQKNSEHKTPNILLIRNIALFVTSIMKMFGVSTSDDEIGFGEVDGEKFSATGKEDLLMPYVQALTDFRERVRQIAIGEKFQPILAECDRLRNDVLPQLGVRLEDRKGHTMVKLCDPETLIRERQQEIEQEQKIRLEKELKRQEAAVKEAEREAKRKIPPKDMFIDEKDKYSKFDDKGIPTHDDKGAELSKGSRKKLEKLYAQQEQKYNEYLEAKTGLIVNGVATNGHDKN
jgi:cysteinyl-tRNA synthetase